MPNCQTVNQQPTKADPTMEEFLQARQHAEDQADYNFIQRIIQELTQSCALPIPMNNAAIPPLVLQAFDYFIENYDGAVEERWYCIQQKELNRRCINKIIKLPQQIVSVCGVYPTSGAFNYGVLGDFSLERMIVNNSVLASGTGGTLSDVFGNGSGYGLIDITASLLELQTYKAVFESPITYNYNAYSNDLVLLGSVPSYGDIVLNVFKRCKLQDLYKNYYFFRYCVCLGLRSMSTIIGTFEFKMPGGVTVNYQRFHDMAESEMDKIDEWINKQHSADYFFTSNSI